jgi:membrane protein required for colicin V production
MNWLDFLIIIIITVFTLMGIYRGLIRQVFSIAALVGGIVVGFILYDIAGRVFTDMGLVQNESIANVGGFIIAAFLAYIIIQILGWMTAKIIGTLQLSWINRGTGGVLGFIIGAAVAFLFVSSLAMFYSEKDSVVEKSVLVPYLNETFTVVKNTLPEDFDKSIIRAKEIIREEGFKAAMKIEASQGNKSE